MVDSTKAKIEVMQAFEDGKDIEINNGPNSDYWSGISNPSWDWSNHIYRVKPVKPKPQSPEDRIKAQYPDYDVVILNWDHDEKTDGRMLFFGTTNNYHICAQSMPYYHEYVYDGSEGLFTDMDTVLKVGIHTTQPVAVLFSRGEG